MVASLEPAEFYFLHEGRGEFEFVYNRNQVEADPEATTRLAREIARCRMAIDPDWTAYDYAPTYFDLPHVDLGPELVLAATAFEAARPAALPHYDVVSNPTEGHTSAYYDIVSADWKVAIENVEPGVHQFFPHELRFANGIVSDRFVIRCRGQVAPASPNYRVEDVNDVWNEVVGYKFYVDDTFSIPTLDRERVADRHFVQCPSRRATYVSRSLAEKLLPLLPVRMALLPVKLSGEAPRSVPFVSPALVEDVLKGAIDTPPAFSDGRPVFGKRRSSAPPPPPPPPSSPLDPELANAVGVLNDPAVLDDAPRNRAQSILEGRLASASVERIFVIMAEALKSNVPLDTNFAANFCYFACYERPERELLPYCRAWAADPSPLRRVAAARVLSRQISEDERPHPETFAILTGLLDDHDPNVVAQTIGILAWLFHPAYTEALRIRRDRFAHHESPKVREFCRGLIDREQERAAQAVPDFAGQGVATLFAAAFEAMRSGNGISEPHLEALRNRDIAEVAAVAAGWAHDANPEKRKLAAEALERPFHDSGALPRVALDLLRKLSGDSDAAVAAAAVKALGAARSQGPISVEDIAAVKPAAGHPSAAARAAYADSLAFGQSPEALDALLALADDPAEEVRRSAALHLQSYIEDSVGPQRERLCETLAGLASDSDRYVRYFAIDALNKFDDPRAVEAIERELEGHDEELLFFYQFLLPAVLERPNKRYLPGLKRMNEKFPGNPGIEEAIGACRVKRWFPWG